MTPVMPVQTAYELFAYIQLVLPWLDSPIRCCYLGRTQKIVFISSVQLYLCQLLRLVFLPNCFASYLDDSANALSI